MSPCLNGATRSSDVVHGFVVARILQFSVHYAVVLRYVEIRHRVVIRIALCRSFHEIASLQMRIVSGFIRMFSVFGRTGAVRNGLQRTSL